MKKLFVFAVLAVFALYCYGSVRYAAVLQVPDYVNVRVDLYGHMSVSRWKKDPTAQARILDRLAARQCQPPATGLVLPNGTNFPLDHVLTADDLRQVIEAEPVNVAREITLRDPVRIRALVAKGRTLRDDIRDEDGKVLFAANAPIDKAMIDKLLALGVEEVKASGKGGIVSVQAGTMGMVCLIFLALACALDIVLFKPLVAVMDERNAEIESGQAQARGNIKDQAKLTEEEGAKRRALRRAHLDGLLKARHAVMVEADGIMKEANVEAHRLRDNAHMEMKQMIAQSEEALKADIDALAHAVVGQLRGDVKA